ncbi:MAG: SH3 domain-containing protein [Sphingorhabdus sp.]
MNNIVKLLVLGGTFIATSTVEAQSTRKVPYWASIKSEEARMRTGPSTEFPVKWVYKRQYLPVKVIAVHEVWRKVEDPDGDQGWMHVSLLTPNRTAIVAMPGISELRDEPVSTSRISWRVEKGVVGRIDDCEKGWCRLDVAGRAGYIETDKIWGEEVP